MRTASLVTIILLLALLFIGNRDTCSFALGSSDETPRRLVIIKGKATIINLPDAGEVPATSETLIFQKVGCESCFDGANVDVDGN